MIKVVNNCDTEGHLFPTDWCGQELIHEEDLIKAYEYHNNSNNIVMAVVWNDRSGTGIVREWYESIPRCNRYSMFETLYDVSRYVPSDNNFYKEDSERRDAGRMAEMETNSAFAEMRRANTDMRIANKRDELTARVERLIEKQKEAAKKNE